MIWLMMVKSGWWWPLINHYEPLFTLINPLRFQFGDNHRCVCFLIGKGPLPSPPSRANQCQLCCRELSWSLVGSGGWQCLLCWFLLFQLLIINHHWPSRIKNIIRPHVVMIRWERVCLARLTTRAGGLGLNLQTAQSLAAAPCYPQRAEN